ncbi:HDOD domain-containing protein [Salinimonas sediminis]|uniref:HDOD domain-containing protein n=1 Tax=Salinimonas sediminis TaxID=2303538 RepID=A0A346NL25_9ALTE|nr:HDOD domain-containing protein [Salinimonas sediminis]AXR06232.1 HDOD domain-containing protein [Salinimonas sediminis]
MNVQELAVSASEVFVLPEAVTRLKECMDDHAASMDDVAEIISFDPGLTSQILKVANSALYRFPNAIETITKALQVIGTRSAYDLALAYGVTHAFGSMEANIIDLDKFWEQSVSCGLLAKYFAEYKRQREPERLFVAGLLHNIGELVVVSTHPKEATRCLAFNSRVGPNDLQRAVLGFTYAELSAELIKQWGIPATIHQPIRALHQPLSSDLDASIMQLSYTLALDNVHPDIYPELCNLEPHLHETLDLARDELEDALDITNLQCISVIALFNPNSFVLF